MVAVPAAFSTFVLQEIQIFVAEPEADKSMLLSRPAKTEIFCANSLVSCVYFLKITSSRPHTQHTRNDDLVLLLLPLLVVVAVPVVLNLVVLTVSCSETAEQALVEGGCCREVSLEFEELSNTETSFVGVSSMII